MTKFLWALFFFLAMMLALRWCALFVNTKDEHDRP